MPCVHHFTLFFACLLILANFIIICYGLLWSAMVWSVNTPPSLSACLPIMCMVPLKVFVYNINLKEGLRVTVVKRIYHVSVVSHMVLASKNVQLSE